MRSRLAAGRFHPELRTGSRFLPRAAVSPRLLRLARKAVGLLPADPDFVESTVSATAAIRVYRPSHAPAESPALLYVHGGGLLIGSPLQDEAALRSVADELGVVVATVRYRLAPEHRFPAARDDCFDALRWLAARPGVDADRVAIGGGSAGGGLAAAVALHARDQGGPALCLQLLVYPMLDDRTAARPDPAREHRRLWSNEANHYGWSSYLGHTRAARRRRDRRARTERRPRRPAARLDRRRHPRPVPRRGPRLRRAPPCRRGPVHDGRRTGRLPRLRRLPGHGRGPRVPRQPGRRAAHRVRPGPWGEVARWGDGPPR